jgi:UDP-N-acetylmuramoyl-L-alanyl-D-glutamate--2,6-diaminopimelate ligase
MALLKDILYKVSLKATSGDMNVAVQKVCFDSREVAPGDLFVAVRGTQSDGHAYIAQAIQAGAVAVLSEEAPGDDSKATYCQVDDSAEALGIVAANFYGNPSHQLTLVAVTGTNGKTTTVFLLHQLFQRLGYNAGLLSTVHNKVHDTVIKSSHTTGDALQINRLMRQMVDAGCTHCFMEASSHAIHQRRIAGLDIDLAIFTNITHDHLDYHATFDAYIKAKKRLFDDLPSSAFALVNIDDKRGRVMLQNTKASKYSYSVKTPSDFKAKIISNTLQGLELELDSKSIWFNFIGDFNAYNITSAYAAGVLLGEDADDVLTELSSLQPVSGRFERIENTGKIVAIVDYAHTPDALKNVLETINSIRTTNEQVITVVGCGGNRDKEKRPVMGEIAGKYSTKVILTADNPRSEDPEQIIREMKDGVRPGDFKKILTIGDRREAIRTAVALASAKDIILVAGKGHEDYQEIKGERHHFSDQEELRKALDELYNDKPGRK